VKYVVTPHARKRMKERNIAEKDVIEALMLPTKVLSNEKQRMLFKKIYKKEGKERLLLIAGEQKGNIFEIITVIETSKIKKYL